MVNPVRSVARMLKPLRLFSENVRLSVRYPKEANAALKALGARPTFTCPLCHYQGPFKAHGRIPRPNSLCPRCLSVERHRLLKLYLDRHPGLFEGKRVIHFAPEAIVQRLIRSLGPSEYKSADLFAKADLTLNIEAMDLADGAFDVAVCSHVLEHVDDRKALPELRRILGPGGTLIAMVPCVGGWSETFEPKLGSDEERLRYLLHPGHLRLYGRDFTDRMAAAGFAVEEFAGTGFDTTDHALIRGEKVFIGRVPA